MPDADQADFWNERYGSEDYLFGTQPNAFLAREAYRLAPGSRVLAVADGEGRNSVFLAQHGHKVLATDISERALDKARRFAAWRGVEIDFRLVDLASWEWPEEGFDAVAAIFIQFASPDVRAKIFQGFAHTLKADGLLLLEGYREEQLGNGTGGPSNPENLYTEAMLREAFRGWTIERLVSSDVEIEEGTGHSGLSALVNLVARKSTPCSTSTTASARM